MTAAGCRWMGRWGLEMPLYFAPEGFTEDLTLHRSNATPLVAAECKAAREGVALLDITGFSRYEVTGSGAEGWLDRLFASRLPKPGRSALAPMLSETGKLKGDLTILNWGGGRFWIMGSYYLRQWHMRWFEDHMGEGVALRDISDDIGGFALIGPRSRKVLQALTHQDVSNAAFPFMACQTLDLGLLRTKVNRMSVAGELGYEINCHALEHATLREMLLKAGQGAVREIGYLALLSLRLEKSFGIWSAEFTQGYTPGATGMDRFIAWDKGDFIGRAAALKERETPSARVLVTLEVAATDTDASGYEPVWQDGQRVGFITSGGYGHWLGRSLAMAMVDRAAAAPGTRLSTHVVGQQVAATVIAPSPYDPRGAAMRG
jgi:dimethylglycine dehydrogenase